MEIVNPGGLVHGITLSDLGKKSLSRNKLLFGLLSRMNLVEKAGTGILRIRTAMKEYKLESPEIETDENWFTISFKRPDLQKESYEQRFYGSSQKSSQKILDLIEQNPEITIEEMASKLSLTGRAIKKNLAKLKEKGLLKRICPDKGGYWEILNKRNYSKSH